MNKLQKVENLQINHVYIQLYTFNMLLKLF